MPLLEDDLDALCAPLSDDEPSWPEDLQFVPSPLMGFTAAGEVA